MGVSKLLFYAQSTGTVISGQTKMGVSKLVFYAQTTGSYIRANKGGSK